MDVIPKDISTQNQALHIQWSDGHLGIYPFFFLRCSCPCAGCVHEWTRERLIDPQLVDKDIKPTKADYVGRYALSIEWSDGHTTGIFTFEHLRKICQCPSCTREKSTV